MEDIRDEVFFEDFQSVGFSLSWLRPLLRVIPGLIFVKLVGFSIRNFMNLHGLYWEASIDIALLLILILPHMFSSFNQLSKLKNAEKQLVASKRKYQSVVDSVREVIFQVDRDGRWTFLNSAWAKVTGFIVEESLGEHFTNYVLPENQRLSLRIFNRLISGGIENCTYEFASRSRDGKKFWMEMFVQATKDLSGEIIGASGIITDITVRKSMEMELKKRDKLLRGISEATRILMEGTDYRKAFGDALTKLGEITKVDKINVCRFEKSSESQKIIYSWSRDEEEEAVSKLLLLRDNIFRKWISTLEEGGIVSGAQSDFDEDEWDDQVTRSFVILPLIVDNILIGCVEFLDFNEERVWTSLEKTTLMAAAVSIGSAIKRAMGERELKKALQNDFTRIVRNLQNIVFRLEQDDKGEIYYTLFEGKAAGATGYSTESMQGKKISEILGEEKAEYVLKYYKKAFEGEYVTYEFEFNNRATLAALSPIFENGRVIEVIGSVTDITDKKEAEKKIEYMAYYDALTGLPNRAMFSDNLNNAIKGARRKNKQAAVMFFDLDNFKKINDTLGHGVGDILLKEVSKRLATITYSKEFISRMGGDEFTLLLPDIDNEESAAKKAREVLEVFKSCFNIEGNEFFITPSIGISIYPGDGQDMDELIKNADMAMYRAKEYGKNNYQFYTVSMNDRAVERLTMENDLRRAIDNNELYLVYQPKVDMVSGKSIGCEALIRWNHPERGFVSPGEFISFAEETGLIVPIGEWVLHTACRQNKLWQDMGCKNVRISINISAVQFNHGNLIETVTRVLEETGLDPKYLEMEITENIIMQNTEKVLGDLRMLKSMGVTISIDDFGTGFSSLSYLKKFSIDIIKIDQSFIKDLNSSPNDEAIVTAIINMAKSLNLRVIAEGVETEEQLKRLKEKECNEIQGYLCGRPMKAEEFRGIIYEDRSLIGA